MFIAIGIMYKYKHMYHTYNYEKSMRHTGYAQMTLNMLGFRVGNQHMQVLLFSHIDAHALIDASLCLLVKKSLCSFFLNRGGREELDLITVNKYVRGECSC